MARPRKVSDDKVFEGVSRVMQRLGPAQWTLADVAREVGITAGAIVQRFGSKRALQVLLAEQFAQGAAGMYEEIRRAHPSPLAAVRAYANQMSCLAASPQDFAHHLDYLRLDLTDPDMYRAFRKHAEVAQAFVRDSLHAAVAAGELKPETDTSALARQVETTLTGSLCTWAVYQEGPASEWVSRDIEVVLGPWVIPP